MRIAWFLGFLIVSCSSSFRSEGGDAEDAQNAGDAEDARAQNEARDDAGTDTANDAECSSEATAIKQCGECQPGYYLSRLYAEMGICPYQLRDCSVPCGTFLWCEWNRATPCPEGWHIIDRVSTQGCGEGSDAVDGANTTVCAPD